MFVRKLWSFEVERNLHAKMFSEKKGTNNEPGYTIRRLVEKPIHQNEIAKQIDIIVDLL